MNGTLEPENTPGGGLTMTIRLPAAESSVDGAGQDASPAILDRIDHWRSTGSPA